MRAEGLCRHVGITAEAPSGALEHLLRSGAFDVLQIAFSVICQSVCDHQRERARGVIPLARSLGMACSPRAARRPASSRACSPPSSPEGDPARAARLALRFVLSTPEVDCALVGMRTVVEAETNAALAADPAARLDVRALHDRFA